MTESTRSPDASPSRAIALAREALASEPAGLLTDFDGTVSGIVTDPRSARLADGAYGALHALAGRLAVVAVITGRSVADARAIASVPGVLLVGNHGMEWLEAGAAEPVTSADAASLDRNLEEALGRIPEMVGVLPEHKGISASVHYRMAPDPEAARSAIVEALGDVEPLGLRIAHGRKIVEVRPVGLGDKGTAVRAIVERHGLRGVVVMGDDMTDLDMFRAVADLREAGGVRGAIIGVASADHEIAPELAAAADAVLADPAQAAQLLAALADPDDGPVNR